MPWIWFFLTWRTKRIFLCPELSNVSRLRNSSVLLVFLLHVACRENYHAHITILTNALYKFSFQAVMYGPVKMFCSSSQKMKSSSLNAGMWEALAGERVTWRAEMARVLLAGEQHITLAEEEKRAKRKAGLQDFNNSIWGTVHLPELWSSANPRQTFFPSVKTSKVRLIFGPCPTDAY